MRIKVSALAGAALAVILAGPAAAQTQIEWKQTLNTPKGTNLPQGIRAEMLGMEMGDAFAVTKPRMQALAAEGAKKPASPDPSVRSANQMMGEDQRRPLQEKTAIYRLPIPGGSMSVTASYVSEISVNRELPGSGKDPVRETIRARFTAPSSGNQLVLIERGVTYSEHVVADQPRISELLAQLKAKYGPNPQVSEVVSSVKILFQFDNGTQIATANPLHAQCYTFETTGPLQSTHIPEINRPGNCDVILLVEIQQGISKDHARSIKFSLSDNERAKANFSADFAFLNAYLRDLQTNTKGVAPKL